MKILAILVLMVLTGAMILSFAPTKEIKEISPTTITVIGLKNEKDSIEQWLKKSATEAQKRMQKFLNETKASCVSLEKLGRTENEFGKMIREVARKNSVPGNIAVALAASESGGDSSAVNYNSNGSVDKGLFQLNSRGVGAGLSDEELFNPKKNTEKALSHLSMLLEKYNDEKIAIIAYKIGAGAVDSLIDNNQFNKNNYLKAELVISLSQKTKQ